MNYLNLYKLKLYLTLSKMTLSLRRFVLNIETKLANLSVYFNNKFDSVVEEMERDVNNEQV